jgi:phenylacetate-CoA ligase
MVRFHGIFVDQPNVIEGQIIQQALDCIQVKVVAAERFGNQDVADIIRRIHQRVGPQVQVDVQTVDSIPRTAAGKFQAVVSLLREQGMPSAERTGEG